MLDDWALRFSGTGFSGTRGVENRNPTLAHREVSQVDRRRGGDCRGGCSQAGLLGRVVLRCRWSGRDLELPGRRRSSSGFGSGASQGSSNSTSQPCCGSSTGSGSSWPGRPTCPVKDGTGSESPRACATGGRTRPRTRRRSRTPTGIRPGAGTALSWLVGAPPCSGTSGHADAAHHRRLASERADLEESFGVLVGDLLLDGPGQVNRA